MEKTSNLFAWTEVGYSLFAEEGIDGIQIERLARILQLNKSGFYHYFGDLDVFYLELLALHQKKAVAYLNDLRKIKTIDPEYLDTLVQHKVPIMFQVQLIRLNESGALKVAQIIDLEELEILRNAWNEYLCVHDNSGLAMRYFDLVRDMCYARISINNISASYLRVLFRESKALMQRLAKSSAILQLD